MSQRKATSSRLPVTKQELATELGKLSRRGSVATDTILLVGDEVPGPASATVSWQSGDVASAPAGALPWPGRVGERGCLPQRA